MYITDPFAAFMASLRTTRASIGTPMHISGIHVILIMLNLILMALYVRHDQVAASKFLVDAGVLEATALTGRPSHCSFKSLPAGVEDIQQHLAHMFHLISRG